MYVSLVYCRYQLTRHSGVVVGDGAVGKASSPSHRGSSVERFMGDPDVSSHLLYHKCLSSEFYALLCWSNVQVVS